MNIIFPPACSGIGGGSGRGGFYLEPNPMKEHVNYFPASDGKGGYLGRTYAMLNLDNNISDDKVKPFAEDQQRMVVIKYSTYPDDPINPAYWVYEYLVCAGTHLHDDHVKGNWQNPFNVASAALDFSTHSVGELKDGPVLLREVDLLQTVQNDHTSKLTEVIHDVRSIGAELSRGDFMLVEDEHGTLSYVLDCAKAVSHFGSTTGTVNITKGGTEEHCKIDINLNVDGLQDVLNDPNGDVSTVVDNHKVKINLKKDKLRAYIHDLLIETTPTVIDTEGGAILWTTSGEGATATIRAALKQQKVAESICELYANTNSEISIVKSGEGSQTKLTFAVKDSVLTAGSGDKYNKLRKLTAGNGVSLDKGAADGEVVITVTSKDFPGISAFQGDSGHEITGIKAIRTQGRTTISVLYLVKQLHSLKHWFTVRLLPS